MKFIRSVSFAAFLMHGLVPALAQEFKSGDITIDQPWARATPKGAPVGGGYMVIHNTGKTEDRLVGGAFDFAGKIQIHEMTMQNGIMKMRPLPSGLVIPPGGTVTLDPNGYHLMFMNLKRPLTQGEVVKGDLKFEHAGMVPVEFKVGGIGDKGPGAAGNSAPAPMSKPDKMQMPM